MNAELDSVIRRIQKLLAIAQDDRANPNEASAAAGQAEKLMRKYQIDNADLIMREIKNDVDALETVDVRADAITNGTKPKEVPPWARILSAAVAKLNDVGARIVRTEELGACVRFYGYKSDVLVAKWMMDYLLATINRLAKAYRETDDYKINGRGVLADYRKGVVFGITGNIHKMVAEREAEMAAAAQTGRALMIVKQDAIVKRYGDVFKVKRSPQSIRRGDTYSNGMQDGRKVDINRRGLQNSSSSGQLRIGN